MTRKDPVIWLQPGLAKGQYTKWLRLGLAQFFREGMGAWALPGLADCFARNPTLAEDIIDALHKLPLADQDHFRDAVVEITRELDFNAHMKELEALLQIGLAYKSKGMLDIIATKAFTVKDSDHWEPVLILCFEYARDAGPEAISCLRHLTSQKTFPYEFSAQALEAMAAADKSHFADHFNHLRDGLDRIFKILPDGEADFVRAKQRRALLVHKIQRYGLDVKKLLDPAIDVSKESGSFWWFEAVLSTFDFKAEESGFETAAPSIDLLSRKDALIQQEIATTSLSNVELDSWLAPCEEGEQLSYDKAA
jgi:hypothetical protein